MALLFTQRYITARCMDKDVQGTQCHAELGLVPVHIASAPKRVGALECPSRAEKNRKRVRAVDAENGRAEPCVRLLHA